jgi:hypothetical protein
LLLLMACSGKKDEAGAAGGSAAPAPSPVTTPVAAPSGRKPLFPGVETAERSRAMCEAALPAEGRPGLRIEGAVVGGHMTCNLYRDKALAGSVTADCARGTSLEDFQNKRPKVRFETIPGLGRAAWRARSLMGITQFYDGQAECECKATSFKKGVDDLALARAFEAGLTLETAPKAPPPVAGEAQLRCDDVVPPPLRDRHGFSRRVEQSASFGTVRCVYSGKGSLIVDLDCKQAARPALERLDAKRRAQKSLGRWKKDLDLGNGAFLEADKVTFVDPETECLVTTSIMKKRPPDVVPIARAIEKSVTRESIGRSSAE